MVSLRVKADERPLERETMRRSLRKVFITKRSTKQGGGVGLAWGHFVALRRGSSRVMRVNGLTEGAVRHWEHCAGRAFPANWNQRLSYARAENLTVFTSGRAWSKMKGKVRVSLILGRRENGGLPLACQCAFPQ